MKTNLGNCDRKIRIVIGAAILVWGFMASSWYGAIGLIPLATGIIGWCPAYCPLGLSTKGSCCSSGTCSKE